LRALSPVRKQGPGASTRLEVSPGLGKKEKGYKKPGHKKRRRRNKKNNISKSKVSARAIEPDSGDRIEGHEGRNLKSEVPEKPLVRLEDDTGSQPSLQ